MLAAFVRRLLACTVRMRQRGLHGDAEIARRDAPGNHSAAHRGGALQCWFAVLVMRRETALRVPPTRAELNAAVSNHGPGREASGLMRETALDFPEAWRAMGRKLVRHYPPWTMG